MLALARAFMQRPRLLLLDEPSLGLAPLLVAEIFRIVRELNESEGLTVLRRRAERAHRARSSRRRAYVLEVGPRRALRAERELAAARLHPPELPGLLMAALAHTARPDAQDAVSTGAIVPSLLVAAVRLPARRLAAERASSRSRPSPGLANGAIYASLALALVLIYRATEVINFAQGELAMCDDVHRVPADRVGPLVLARVLPARSRSPSSSASCIQLVPIRPVQRRSVIAVVIVTVGLFILIDGLVSWIWGGDLKFMPAPFGNTVYHVGGVAFSRQDSATIAVSILSVVAALGCSSSSRSSASRCALLRSARRRAARRRPRQLDARARLGPRRGARRGRRDDGRADPSSSQPTMMQAILLYAFAAAVLGGLESPAGAVIGGLAIGVFLNLARQYVGW